MPEKLIKLLDQAMISYGCPDAGTDDEPRGSILPSLGAVAGEKNRTIGSGPSPDELVAGYH